MSAAVTAQWGLGKKNICKVDLAFLVLAWTREQLRQWLLGLSPPFWSGAADKEGRDVWLWGWAREGAEDNQAGDEV